ncbi:MAG: glutamine synthetase beta-grasp domain-containing protein [Candidatus Marinimicrobia bacterium]|nr:glutamine synthetase beta-grasp domain-containing protein [Candidatus Neomarinimicrobiota bacterium]
MNLTIANKQNKKAEDMQRSDILEYIQKNDVETIVFQYIDLEGDIRELIIPINSIEYAHRVLASGERIDGSSIFKEIIPTGQSDLYIIPNYSTAYRNPFDENSINIVCNFVNKDEKRANFTPSNVLRNASNMILEKHGLELWALGEIEFYLIGEYEKSLFELPEQSGYHQTEPYLKYRVVANEIAKIVSQITGNVKYAHGEVGHIHKIENSDSKWNGMHAEQYEVEFLPAPIEIAGLNVSIAKWVARNVASQYGLGISMAPKLQDKQAGNGLHFHLELLKNKNNIMRKDDGELSDESLAIISSLCEYASSLIAIGNRVDSSYTRLNSGQETPSSAYWNELDRNALVRIPLAWQNGEYLASIINDKNRESYRSPFKRQTVELRSADGSANHFFLLAGICQAIYVGLNNIDEYKNRAKELSNPNHKLLEQLPKNRKEASELFDENRDKYSDVFSDEIIGYIVNYLEK